ncbi:MAG: phosphoadenylyl-sulfate reductase [Bacteroidetes bacterium]|nr:phosphoadenylyl-sulfate reductase [Bacteroidota bacterium]
MKVTTEEIAEFNHKLQYYSTFEVLSYFLRKYRERIALASNMGAEDQVLTDMIVGIDNTARIITLDTEKLFTETYRLIEETNNRYNIYIQVYTPDPDVLKESFMGRPFHSIYESIEFRKRCCYARKVEPLKRALKGLDVWITGLRREQSVTREKDELIEWDDENGLLKINPLIEWSEEKIWNYIHAHNVPYNSLHNKGYPSIGCEPCTKAIEEGEDIRAGRWWWEKPEYRECGLHKH